MMRIVTIIMAVGLLTLTGCSEESEPVADSGISFGASVKQADTRAGETACMDNAVLAETGFGVFSYSTVEGFSSWLNNTQIEYKGTVTADERGIVHLHPDNWSYGTTKVWPKEGKISFFAYAPYTSDSDAPGITGFSGGGTNDPTVSYQVAKAVNKCVDLLWGVKGTTGLPWLNATKSDNTILFNFRHALAAVGFRAQVMVDQDNNLYDPDDATKTGMPGTSECKVTIKSITLSATGGGSFYETGTLHLNNDVANQPQWTDQSGGLNDFKLSGESGIVSSLRAPETYPTTVEDIRTFMDGTAVPGVTEAANSQMVIPRALNGKEQCWMFIPKTAQDYQLKVEYYVTYKTSSTPTYNTYDYTKTIDIKDWTLAPDTKYYFNLVFGLKTLGLTVTAQDWTDEVVPATVIVEHGTSASQSLSRQGF